MRERFGLRFRVLEALWAESADPQAVQRCADGTWELKLPPAWAILAAIS